MAVDARGLSLTGSAAAAIAYDQAIDHLIRFQAEVVDAAAVAVATDPGCALAGLLCAYLALMSTEESAVAGGRDALASVRAGRHDLLPRERAHLAAAERWVAGDMTGAGELLSEISVEYPRDLLALAVGHQIDFFTGSAVNLRDRIGRALGGWHADDRQLGFVHGMYAFGLEECNLYRQSEEIGQAAVERNPDDVWGIHAVVHTYEMAGRIPDGVRFMRSREADWMAGNFLNVHNSWHYALYLLQGGDADGALAVYDRILHHEGSDDVALELLDASALLWRLQLEGTGVGDRWQPLASAWGRLLAPGFYPFNDMHAVMAFIGNGELDRAENVVRDLEEAVAHGNLAATGPRMTATVGLPVCRSLLHFGRGEYGSVITGLMPIRTRIHEFGGSHAQRDAVERTLLEAAIRAGRLDLAAALVSERLSVRECNTYAWSKRAALMSATGNRSGAASAMARAGELAREIRAAASITR
jgi:tetratricopeptide (TPR) repeat protein